MAVDPINRMEAILSGESVTPANRMEAILQGQDITPVTREEYYLKQLADGSGGGGGGRTATFIATQTLTPEEYEGGIFVSYPEVTTAPSSPETLTVTFNGTTYTVPYDYDYDCWGAHYDNDLGAFDWSVYPFGLYYNGMGVQLYTASASNVTISATFTQTSIVIRQNGEYNVEGLTTAIVGIPEGYQKGTFLYKPMGGPVVVQALAKQTLTQSDYMSSLIPGSDFVVSDTQYVAVNNGLTNLDCSVKWSKSGNTLNFTVTIHNNSSSDITLQADTIPGVYAFSKHEGGQ